MKKRYPSPLVLAYLSIVLAVTAACVPLPTPVPATATPSNVTNVITDIVWQWTSVSNQTTKETTTVAKPQDYTITFRDDGTLSGKADCNDFTGTYSQAGGFTIKLGATTMAACGEGSLDQQYLELLSAVVVADPTAKATWRWKMPAARSACCSRTAARRQRQLPPRLPPRRPAKSPTSSGSGKRWRT